MSAAAPSDEQPVMIETPSVISIEAQTAAIVRLTVPRSDMPVVMGPAIRDLRNALRAQGLSPKGAMFAHHLRMDDAVFDFEVGIPTDQAVAASGRVRPGSLPGGLVARTTYRGGYEGLAAAWDAFLRWMQDNGYERAADLWEVYVAGPETSADCAEWRTELNQPVHRRAMASDPVDRRATGC